MVSNEVWLPSMEELTVPVELNISTPSLKAGAVYMAKACENDCKVSECPDCASVLIPSVPGVYVMSRRVRGSAQVLEGRSGRDRLRRPTPSTDEEALSRGIRKLRPLHRPFARQSLCCQVGTCFLFLFQPLPSLACQFVKR